MAKGFAFWTGLRRTLWAAVAGSLVGAGVFAWLGVSGMWVVLPALVTAAVVASILAGRIRPAAKKDIANGDPALPVLSPLAREVLERLPDPLMLVDTSGRVLFANRAMREVIGVGAERKHVSSLLRTPAVLEALARTSASGVRNSWLALAMKSTRICSERLIAVRSCSSSVVTTGSLPMRAV